MKIVDTFYAIDFDRTLGDVNANFDLLANYLHEHGVMDKDELMAHRKAEEARGESFSVLGYLRRHHSDTLDYEKFARGYQIVAAEHPGSLLIPGALEFLQWLEESGRAYGVVSYGNRDWQTLKIEASGLAAIPRIIVDTPRKSELFQSWQQPDGTFHLPRQLARGGSEIAAKTLVLIDDKLSAFDAMPPGERGYWLRTWSQQKDVPAMLPEKIVMVDSFDEIRAFEAEEAQ